MSRDPGVKADCQRPGQEAARRRSNLPLHKVRRLKVRGRGVEAAHRSLAKISSQGCLCVCSMFPGSSVAKARRVLWFMWASGGDSRSKDRKKKNPEACLSTRRHLCWCAADNGGCRVIGDYCVCHKLRLQCLCDKLGLACPCQCLLVKKKKKCT